MIAYPNDDSEQSSGLKIKLLQRAILNMDWHIKELEQYVAEFEEKVRNRDAVIAYLNEETE
jgi:hypothetical protein